MIGSDNRFSALLNSISDLLTEAYAGPPDPRATWFVDNAPDAGIFGILAGITAQEASTPVDSRGNAGSTIAAHAEHLRWSLANANATFRGEPWNPDWSESWRTIRTSPSEWDWLRDDLRRQFENLRDAIQAQEELSGEVLNGVIALIPHAAYHLGTIRQMLERVRERQ